jgi:predicted nucleotidyltransferase
MESMLRSDIAVRFSQSRRLEGVLADITLSKEGAFVRFEWADWPDDLKLGFAAHVEQFREDRPYLHAVEPSSPEWNAIFGGTVADCEAATKVAEILGRRLGRVSWVRAERDLKGKVKAWVGLEDGKTVDLCLSWKGYTAGGIGVSNMQALRAAVDELQAWAGHRIQSILDVLHERLSALYGERFRGLYVFGSYAMPDAGIDLGENSDLDVALILSDFDNLYDERKRIGDIVYDLSLEHVLVISVVPIREADFREGQTNFTRVISSYAIPVR